MTAKEYLSQSHKLDRQINMKLKKLAAMKAALFGKSVTYDNDGAQKQPNGNAIENAIYRVLAYEEEVNADIDKLVTQKMEIERSIAGVKDENQREVLERRYICHQKWEAIAVEMRIDLRWIYRLHNKALATLTQIDHG
ncbi:MAG: DUF1492 domain-containing protein [Oscillospiraceae bacterium]